MTAENSHKQPRCWIIVPAAGIGTRMGAGIPKQYLTIGGKTILEYTLERLLQVPQLAGIFLALGHDDPYWSSIAIASNPKINVIAGGNERCNSVLNGLQALQDKVAMNDWILVHDAARPCITLESIIFLMEQLKDHQVGGILGVPVSDTLKNVDQSHAIQYTVDRSPLWQAQTPQMFRYGLLHDCLRQALAERKTITDEASAIETCGYQPLMVQGRSDNIKITHPEDLAIAKFILQQQARDNKPFNF